MINFLLTDFNNSNGVGTSTSCFCLNYHTCLLPIHFKATAATTTTTSLRTSTILDFLQTDFNDSTGVGTSTICFCLDNHNFPHLRLLPFRFSRLRQQQQSHCSIIILRITTTNQEGIKSFRISITYAFFFGL